MNLLVADDEFIIREGIAGLDWKSIGIDEVYSAANGLDAKEILEVFPVDIAILDIRMLGMTGIDLAKYVSDNELDVSVVFLTGYAEFEYARKAISYGVSEYIIKPFKQKELLSLVEKIIAKRQKDHKGQISPSEADDSINLVTEIRNHFENTDDMSKRIITKMVDQHASEISLYDFAEQYHFSSAYLSRKIKQDTGFTFMDLLKAIRLSFAVRNIYSGMKISESGYQAGFPDQAYFSQVFKSVFGFTPSELKINVEKCPSFEEILSSTGNRQKRDEKKKQGEDN